MPTRSVLLKLLGDPSSAEHAVKDVKDDLKKFDGYTAQAKAEIKTEAAQAKLQKLHGQLARLGRQEATPDVKIRTANVVKQIDRIEQELDHAVGKRRRLHIVGGAGVAAGERAASGVGLGGALGAAKGGAGTLVAAGGAAAVGVGIVSVREALALEVVEARLQKQIESAGVSFEKYGEKIHKTSEELALLSGIHTRDLLGSFTTLFRATGDVTKALQLNALAADYARAKNVDVATAAVLLSKVQAGNTGVLKRAGLAFTPITTAQDKLKESTKAATVEQKRAAKAIDLQHTAVAALALVQRKFGGQAAAYGKTTQGSLDRVSVASETLKEKIGKGLEPAIRAGSRAMLNAPHAISTFSKALGKPKSYLDALRSAIKLTADSLVHNFSHSWRIVKNIFVSGLNDVIKTINSATRGINSLDALGVVPNIPKIGLVGQHTGVQQHKRAPSKGTAGGDPAGRFKSRGAPVIVNVSTPGGGSPDPRVLAHQLGREIRRRGG